MNVIKVYYAFSKTKVMNKKILDQKDTKYKKELSTHTHTHIPA